MSEGKFETALTADQKNAVAKNIEKQGATFFSWSQLQDWIRRFGPNTNVSEVQKKLKEQKKKEIKH